MSVGAGLLSRLSFCCMLTMQLRDSFLCRIYGRTLSEDRAAENIRLGIAVV